LPRPDRHRAAGLLRRLDPHADAGAVGGVEVLPFGVLIFVVGSLLILNTWAVIDAKLAITAGAREGARAVVEAPVGADALAVATAAAHTALTAQGRETASSTIEVAGVVERCSAVQVTMTYRIPAIVLPWGVGLGSGFTVTSAASELVDPLRTGLEGVADCV
jgi:Flp pilus assembly protein TadG